MTPTASRKQFLALIEELDVRHSVHLALRAPTEAGRVKRFRKVLEGLRSFSTTKRRRLTLVARKKFRSGSALARAFERWRAAA